MLISAWHSQYKPNTSQCPQSLCATEVQPAAQQEFTHPRPCMEWDHIWDRISLVWGSWSVIWWDSLCIWQCNQHQVLRLLIHPLWENQGKLGGSWVYVLCREWKWFDPSNTSKSWGGLCEEAWLENVESWYPKERVDIVVNRIALQELFYVILQGSTDILFR